MKATVLQNDLNKWLAVVVRIVPNRGQLPVLANVLLEATKTGLILSATNLEIGIKVEIGGKVLETGAITIPAKNLAEFVGSLPPGNVEMELSGEKLKISGGKLMASFTGIAASEFPVISSIEADQKQGKTFNLKKQIIENVAAEIAFAAANDESRPVLTGVQFLAVNETLKITATDGFRMSRKIVNIERAVPSLVKGMIIPAKTILEMARIIQEGKKGEVEMGVVSESNQIIMEYDNVVLSSRVLEGNFPDVDKIIPADCKTEVVMEKEDVVRAVKAVGIFARDSANVVKFKVENGQMKVSASASQTGEGEMEIEVEQKGESGSIAFNYRYVLDFLNSVDVGRVKMGMNDSLAPGLFMREEDEGLIHLIMPVRV